MTSNNLEAIELLKSVENDIAIDYVGIGTRSKLWKVIKFLQADEDIEVQNKPTYSCSKCKCNSHISLTCEKPTKETKLEDLKLAYSRFMREREPTFNDLIRLIEILMEEEY